MTTYQYTCEVAGNGFRSSRKNERTDQKTKDEICDIFQKHFDKVLPRNDDDRKDNGWIKSRFIFTLKINETVFTINHHYELIGSEIIRLIDNALDNANRELDVNGKQYRVYVASDLQNQLDQLYFKKAFDSEEEAMEAIKGGKIMTTKREFFVNVKKYYTKYAICHSTDSFVEEIIKLTDLESTDKLIEIRNKNNLYVTEYIIVD